MDMSPLSGFTGTGLRPRRLTSRLRDTITIGTGSEAERQGLVRENGIGYVPGMSSIEQRFKEEIDACESLRAECNARVVKWVYSTEEIWSPWPKRAGLMRPESVVRDKSAAFHAW